MKATRAGSPQAAPRASATPGASATTASAAASAARSSRAIAVMVGRDAIPIAAGSSGQRSRTSNSVRAPPSRFAAIIGSATVSGVEEAMTRSQRPRTACRVAAAA
ncbi:hypothetical protein FK498_18055 [Elioraea sp. Yellowstone]|nr:hypothetical protein FK498_18055 [Elioraea sp. Yellowstone]